MIGKSRCDDDVYEASYVACEAQTGSVEVQLGKLWRRGQFSSFAVVLAGMKRDRWHRLR